MNKFKYYNIYRKILGKEIYSATTNAGMTLVSLGNVSAGMYFIELKKENSTKQLKFTLID